MKCRIVKIEKLSGTQTSLYSVILDDENRTLFDIFLNENKNLFKSELLDILMRLNTIAHKTGAREQFFKLKEGKPGDGICALYDMPDSKLRLYCIRYGSSMLLLGGGGEKLKTIKALQESEKLKRENFLLRAISEEISKRIKSGTIEWENDGMELTGELEFNTEDDE
ncbi:MAG: hypothetical protein K9H49_19905 [Bacteroidales bacterium]|nr:hypothetical protein [Bacteroidales bacterium]MCF8392085.1 hypothetical protein [Bacteroidales bacterium]